MHLRVLLFLDHNLLVHGALNLSGEGHIVVQYNVLHQVDHIVLILDLKATHLTL